MITLALAPLLFLQGATETAVAIENENPETWTVEYPRLIRPFVVEYRRCLNGSNRRVRGEADFEMQHRMDIPRCADEASELVAQSNAALVGARTTMTPQEVDMLFTNIGRIHVARGRDLDDQFTQRIERAAAARENYEATRPKGLVIELRDRTPFDAHNETGTPSAQN